MFGGRIEKKGKEVPGTYRQGAWEDTWEEEHQIKGDVDLTNPAVIRAIQQAWDTHPSNQSGSLYGALRAPMHNSFVRVDVERRVLITRNGCRLCD